MTAVCGGGSSRRKAGAPRYIILNSDVAIALFEANYPWLGPFVSQIPPIAYDLDTFCASDPPALPAWTSDLLLALAQRAGKWGLAAAALEHLAEWAASQVWYQWCECVAGSPSPPIVPPQPADTPVYVPAPTTGASGTYLAAVLADSPWHYWRMPDDPPQVWTDLGSAGKPLTAGATFGNMAGPYTGPNSDSGSGFLGQVTLAIQETANVNLPYTFECWLYYLSISSAGSNMLSGLQGANQVGISHSADSFSSISPTVTWAIHSAASGSVASLIVPMSGWHHFAMVVDSSGAHGYVDGSFQSTLAFATPLPITVVEAWHPSGGAAAFMSEIAFYKGALSAGRIAAHYAAADNRTATPGPLSVDQSIVIDSAARNLQTFLERQVAPSGYVLGQLHAGLSGSGELTVANLLGFSVTVTATGAPTGSVVGDPTTLVGAGYVTIATTDGYLDGVPISRIAELFFPPMMSLATTIAYTLPLGVVVDIRELVRQT